MNIYETIVVEGRDDTAAIKRSVDALTIETHGYGIKPETWELIDKAYHTTGIIVFTDPDHAGEQIRKRILEKFPNAKEAFLDCAEAEKDGDIGIENATPESIREALEKVYTRYQRRVDSVNTEKDDNAGETLTECFTEGDMISWGLTGVKNAAQHRHILGKALGIGFATSKTFLARLNKFEIKRAEIEKILYEEKIIELQAKDEMRKK